MDNVSCLTLPCVRWVFKGTVEISNFRFPRFFTILQFLLITLLNF